MLAKHGLLQPSLVSWRSWIHPKLEAVQRHFNSKVRDIENLNYWERLQAMNLYSQERGKERHMIAFFWKISQNMVKGYSVSFSTSERRGRTVIPYQVDQRELFALRGARESSLSVKGARIFNLLSVTVRNIDSDNIENFKSELETFFSLVPNQPTIPENPILAETNSLLHQIPMFKTSVNRQHIVLF